MESMEMKEIESAIEGILFASGEPVHVERICVALDMDRPTVEQVLQKLMDYYAYERRGIRLLHIEDSWQLCSSPDYADVIRKAFEIRKPAKLSQPALEVLTIIAYYQPTTRAYVDQIRAEAHRGVRTAPGAGTAPVVPHNQAVHAGLPPDQSGRSAGDAGPGRRGPDAAERGRGDHRPGGERGDQRR